MCWTIVAPPFVPGEQDTQVRVGLAEIDTMSIIGLVWLSRLLSLTLVQSTFLNIFPFNYPFKKFEFQYWKPPSVTPEEATNEAIMLIGGQEDPFGWLDLSLFASLFFK